MRRAIIKFRGFEITEREMLTDAIFFLVSFLISIFSIYIFDIHWSFYPGNSIFPPNKYVGIGWKVYLSVALAGSIVGFFVIKLFLVGIKEEDKRWHSKR